ncbi:sugar transferase [Sporocytophaga myxococcoides]|uniref:Sugar transferase n=1 Tax=Sporocytophaga myxococcoides TaxID=153721 RepID=A0A098LCB2_9BACT|nr:sugar transferase [Sporocytophaga myxococcoides]GAL84092.1 sugar transferase [Sporocytophaga myxococcoides]
MYQRIVKPVFDFLFASLAIVALSPLIFLITLFILIFSEKPVFFIQERIGYKGNRFKIVKFRTMKNNLPDGQVEYTFYGEFLRKTSLDELPQLLNILKGDMSFVGPRPLLTEYLPLYNKQQAKRHDVKPGMTGWAQINGRNAISWNTKFDFDLYYVNNCSMFLDLKILILSIKHVLSGAGINTNSGSFVEKFKGN